jgi:phosphoglucomutase
MTLSDALAELYKTYGLYAEKTIDIYMEGLDGIANRKKVMQNLRDCPPKTLGGVAVKSAGDYKSSEVRDLESGEITTTGQPSSDVLYYTLKNDDKIIVRPSGTEPKIKIYLLAHGDDQASLDAKLKAYEKDSRKMTEV